MRQRSLWAHLNQPSLVLLSPVEYLDIRNSLWSWVRREHDSQNEWQQQEK